MSPRPVFNPVRLPSYAPFVGGSFGKPGPFFNNPSRVGGSFGKPGPFFHNPSRVGGSFGKPGPFFNNPPLVGGSDGRSPDEGG